MLFFVLSIVFFLYSFFILGGPQVNPSTTKAQPRAPEKAPQNAIDFGKKIAREDWAPELAQLFCKTSARNSTTVLQNEHQK